MAVKAKKPKERAAPAQAAKPIKGEYKIVSVGHIAASPTNPRKFFDDAKLQELADSIAQVGLLQPIIVRPSKNKTTKQAYYELVVGERRWRATIRAGLGEIACDVRDLSDQQVIEIQCIENDQRSDVTPMERARAYQSLLALEGGLTVEEVAKRLGRSATTVSEYLALVRAPEKLSRALEEGLVSRSVVAMVCRLPKPEECEAAARNVLDGNTYMTPDYSERDWEPLPEATPLTVDGTKKLIERHFSKSLNDAPFSLTDAKLDPTAGPCKKCPKRAGTNPQEYPGAHPNMCFDPACYRNKCELHKVREIEEASLNGCEILADKQMATIIASWSGQIIDYHWADYEGSCEYDPEGRTWKTLCAPHHEKVTVYFGYDNARSQPRWLIKKELVRLVLEGLGMLPKTKTPKTEPETRVPQVEQPDEAASNEPTLLDKLSKPLAWLKCGCTRLAGLMKSFWVELGDDDTPKHDWATHEGDTELGEERMCGDCKHEFIFGD